MRPQKHSISKRRADCAPPLIADVRPAQIGGAMQYPGMKTLIVSMAAALTTTATAADPSTYEADFREALEVCAKIYLPNSMAHSEGIDLASELRRLEATRDAKAQGFASPEGVEFLVEKSKSAQDKIAQACGVDLLAALARCGVTPNQ